MTNYMVSKGYMEVATLETCVAGYPFRISSPSAHIMMMVFNDGATRKYSAHTRDRLQATWSGSTSATYYRVVY